MAHNEKTRPVIGISARRIAESSHGVDERYIHALENAGASPLIIPVVEDEETLHALLTRLDGILFSGGEDIDPLLYRESPHEKLGAVSTARDTSELTCFRKALSMRIPILGICRGLQLINVAMGGTLIQDLPSQAPSAASHLLPEDAALPLESCTHRVKIKPDSALAEILGTASIPANSRHHQAVKELGTGLVANSWTEDGIVEGFELASGDQFLLAVQCHPERLYKAPVPAWKTLFEGFARAALAYKANR
jgi:putative glutamine amidotransferase